MYQKLFNFGSRLVVEPLLRVARVTMGSLVGLGLGLIAGSDALANGSSYSSPDAPETIDWRVAGGQEYTFEINVTDNFKVDGLSLSIDWFSPIVSFVDVFLESPDGTRITVVDWVCRGGPVAWGSRVYQSDVNRPMAVEDGGIPASYTFADGGLPVGELSTDIGSGCNAYWENRDRFSWTWPPEEAANWIDPNTNQPFGNYRNVAGAFIQLPTSNTYGPQEGAFSDYDGKPAAGIWTVTVRKWGASGGPTSTSDWLKGDTKVQSVRLNFGKSGPIVAAESMIQNFMAGRASRLLSEDLNLEERLTNPQNGVTGENAFAFGNGSARAKFAFSFLDGFGERDPNRRYDIWARGAYHHQTTPSGDLEDLIGHFGIDYWLNSNLLIGVLLTLDHAEQTGAAQDIGLGPLIPEVEGSGWLAGPYLVARPVDGLIFNGRVQWGTTSNTIEMPSNGNMYEGDFDTRRFLAQGEISARKELGTFLFEPSIIAGYTQDKMTGPATLISGSLLPALEADQVDVSEGRLAFSHRISKQLESAGFIIIPSIAVAGIWQFDAPDYVDSNGQRLYGSGADPFMRVEGLLRVHHPQGFNLAAGVSYEGIGAEDWDAYSASVTANVPF